MFVQNVIELSAAVHELSCWRRKTQLKTILPSLSRTVAITFHFGLYPTSYL